MDNERDETFDLGNLRLLYWPSNCLYGDGVRSSPCFEATLPQVLRLILKSFDYGDYSAYHSSYDSCLVRRDKVYLPRLLTVDRQEQAQQLHLQLGVLSHEHIHAYNIAALRYGVWLC